MKPDEYRAALKLAQKGSLEHGDKGSEWKNHKYITKIGNRYIYANDLNNKKKVQEHNAVNQFSDAARKAGDKNSVMRNESDIERVGNKLEKTLTDATNGEKAKASSDIQKSLSSRLTDTCYKWLSGEDSEIDLDDVFDYVNTKNIDYSSDERREIMSMAVSDFVNKIDEIAADNPDRFDKDRLKQLQETKKQLSESFKTNRPFASQEAQKKATIDKVKHSFSSKEEFYAAVEQSKDALAHHGIKNMRWGFRRFQNSDGSLTPAGKARYGVGVKTKGDIESESESGLRKLIGESTNFEKARKDIAYKESVKAIGSTLLSAAVVATAVKNGKSIVSNVKNKRYFKAAFDATKVAGKALLGAQLVANAIGHGKNVHMALSTDKMDNDKAKAESIVNAYKYKSANSKANQSEAKAGEQKILTDASYKALGNGSFSRRRAARKNNTPAAQEYNANRSKLLGMQAQAKIDRSRADDILSKSGRNKLERDYNMAKYGSDYDGFRTIKRKHGITYGRF